MGVSGFVRFEYLVTLAYATDTVTERGLRWVKTIKSLDTECLLEDNGKKDTMSLWL